MSGDRWRNTGWYLSPTTTGALLADIAGIGAYSEKANYAWRGMRSIDYDLVSSLQRTNIDATEAMLRERESAILDEARSWGLGYGVGGWSTDLQLLADLQHYGTSTRLIDVTSDPMTALWFACQDVGEPDLTNSGVLIAIDTAGWPRFGRSQPPGTWRSAGNPMGWELEAGLESGQPFVVHSLHPNDRLRAQNGYFVASRVPDRPNEGSPLAGLSLEFEVVPYKYPRHLLDDMLHNTHHVARRRIPFIAVRVRSELKPRLRRILENSYNRSSRVLFPDFAGFRDFSETATPRSSEEEIDSKRPRKGGSV
ncbi:FRG domain-containing protein [Microbacterium sp. QXD-8]|uniref:FRG domain-containing protein n=1 Tax=Microbacterium psychrotolerans TaxID=3068321 RepID=A0ABU0Z6V2_9MICO|nr:FRG domain-containing protein [Microbacterium sp. QXD-8]MDQ7880328.1 FRG domain-containing protein [Microbacterium sp. QXD-8]